MLTLISPVPVSRFVFREPKNRGHTLPEKKNPHEISATFGSGTHTPANCKILYSVIHTICLSFSSNVRGKRDARFQTHKLTIMFTIHEYFTPQRNITGFFLFREPLALRLGNSIYFLRVLTF